MHIRGKKYSNLNELEDDARHLLAASIYGYYSGGAETETTLLDNRAAFSRYRLLPRTLIDVSTVSTSCEIFGMKLGMPVIVAPMAMQRMCDPAGELAMASGANSAGAGMALSTMATSTLEEVASTGCENLWFQLYVLTRRDVTEAMVRDAEAAGYKALVITVDAPRLGKREADDRNKFTLPPGLSLKMMERINQAAGKTDRETTEGSKFGQHFTSLIDTALTWEFIPWIKTVTKLPVLVKGILAPDDARKAVELGADGIIVSNHGGRQLDYAPAAVDMLPFVVKAVRGKVHVLVDGGIRRGTDVIKCLAMGASAVLIGRPMLWALTLGGQEGVKEALNLVQGELELGMALLGCRSLDEISEEFLIPPNEALRIHPSRL